MKDSEYKCSSCGGVFEKSRPDEEALEESVETFGEMKQENLAIVCDDCYNNFMKQYSTMLN